MRSRANVKVRLNADRVSAVDTRRVPPQAKTADPFYASPAWRHLMDEIVAERGRICEDQQCDGRTHHAGMRVFGDHIIELRDGGAPLDKRNVLLRCGASHSRKTAAARAKRLAER